MISFDSFDLFLIRAATVSGANFKYKNNTLESGACPDILLINSIGIPILPKSVIPP